ncbi:2-octaprenyl-6-methoxyphenyl hydroxylase [Wolbachia endosymbiont of Chironomus riparius]|uniref:2-octaprenyl-6-methoxyphenyl hydroxylase n=1 Tax=Wolbachia endosymbiont of Chironomus riparius TaxID=2883238 RepID=UPI0020A1E53A|nr:2-octaprenyl-6-methoxyphenyl hydroxylase [Wolbachia endosymbiont of Chironomus riparius]
MNYDVIISGGGLIGLITAIGLSQNSISAAVIEKDTLPRIPCDNRAFAISQGSKKILEKLGIWQFIEKEAEPILDICILDADSPFTVHYDHKMIGEEPMGYVVDSAIIWNTINSHFLNQLNIFSPHSYQIVTCDSGYVEVALDDQKKLTSQLFICAEGKSSKIPELFSMPKIKFNYKQSSIVCNVKHELHHENLAVERFFSDGPFAILPMKGGYLSSIVWTSSCEIAEMLMSLSDEEFIVELKKRFGSYLGEIELLGTRGVYPLSFSFVKRLYKNRVLLIGDAAHAIHPVAGQGLNLGIRDVESVIRHAANAKVSGIDIGSNYLLQKISRDRLFDNVSMALATDGLNRVFSNRIFCIKVLRNFGLMIVENSSLLKKRFIQHAMGFF